MGILDNGFLIGLEDINAYGVPVPLTNGFAITADQWGIRREEIPSAGMRAGMTAERSDRITVVDMGGEGTAPFEFLDAGMGPVLAALLGQFTGPTLETGATNAYKMEAVTTTEPSSRSFTAQILRSDASTPSVSTAFTHPGAVLTEWELSHSNGGNLGLSTSWVSSEVLRSDQGGPAAGIPQYPAGAKPFHWGHCGVKVGDVSPAANFQCTESVSVRSALGLKTDRTCMRQDTRVKRAIRNALPQYTGQLEVEYFANYIYDLYRDALPVPIVAEWRSSEIEPGHDKVLRITMPECLIIGDATPKSNNDIPMQSVPFKALEGDGAPVMTIEYITTDSAI